MQQNSFFEWDIFLCKYVSFKTAADTGSTYFEKLKHRQLKPETISNCQSISGIKATLSDDKVCVYIEKPHTQI